jgi:uncharacterized protein
MAKDCTEGSAKMAPRYKTAFIVWLAVFPTVNILLMLLSLLPFELPRILSVLLTTGLTVPLSVYNLVPRLSRLFEPWLYKEC